MQTAWAIGATGALVVLGTAAAIALSFEAPLAAWGVAAGVVLMTWMSMPRREGALPRRYVLFFAAFTFSALLPQNLSAPLQIVALVGAFGEWISAPASERRGKVVVIAVAAFIGFWSLLIVHPNVPDLQTGVLGFRKTALAVAGIVFGCAIRERLRVPVERLIVILLTAALTVSLVSYFWFPQINELAASNDADLYTGLFGGEARLQGVFAGPFHTALAGVFLIGWAIVRWRQSRILPKLILVIGFVGMYLTLVRTAYVALALVVAAIVIMSTSLSSFLKRTALLAAIGTLALLIADSATGGRAAEIVSSIGNFATDGRFLNRLPEYAAGFEMFNDSPIFGQGAGSAGDTLGEAFGSNLHVTPHNLLLKIAVEGGLLGLTLWLLLVIAVWRSIDTRTAPGQLAVVAVLAIFGLGITGSAIEALPVTYLLLVSAGVGIGRSRPNDSPRIPPATLQIEARTSP